MEDLTFKEPVIIPVPNYDENGKKLEEDTLLELIPLPVEDMKMTVGFEELSNGLTKLNHKDTELRKEYQKLINKKNKTKATENKAKKLLDEVNQSRLEIEKYTINVLLPAIKPIIEKGVVDFKTQKPAELPKRNMTLPKLMSIAMKILDVTTESNRTDDDGNFRKEEQPKKS